MFNKEISLSHELTIELQAERDNRTPCKITRHKEQHEVRPLPNTPAMEPLKLAEVSKEMFSKKQDSTSDALAL